MRAGKRRANNTFIPAVTRGMACSSPQRRCPAEKDGPASSCGAGALRSPSGRGSRPGTQGTTTVPTLRSTGPMRLIAAPAQTRRAAQLRPSALHGRAAMIHYPALGHTVPSKLTGRPGTWHGGDPGGNAAITEAEMAARDIRRSRLYQEPSSSSPRTPGSPSCRVPSSPSPPGRPPPPGGLAPGANGVRERTRSAYARLRTSAG
jgi:hypothetical protein